MRLFDLALAGAGRVAASISARGPWVTRAVIAGLLAGTLIPVMIVFAFDAAADRGHVQRPQGRVASADDIVASPGRRAPSGARRRPTGVRRCRVCLHAERPDQRSARGVGRVGCTARDGTRPGDRPGLGRRLRSRDRVDDHCRRSDGAHPPRPVAAVRPAGDPGDPHRRRPANRLSGRAWRPTASIPHGPAPAGRVTCRAVVGPDRQQIGPA